MKYYKYSMNMTLLNTLAIILFIPLYIIIYLLNIYEYIDLYFIIYYIVWMFIHEILHGIGFRISKIKNKDITYGITLEKGIMWCMCKSTISKKGIMISLLFPFLFIGITTFFIGLIINKPTLILLSLFNIVGCIGDLLMFFDFLKLPEFKYIDLDDCTGFVLISNNDLTKYKIVGLKLIECTNKIENSKNHNKITISKISKIIIIILMLIVLIVFFKIQMNINN